MLYFLSSLFDSFLRVLKNRLVNKSNKIIASLVNCLLYIFSALVVKYVICTDTLTAVVVVSINSFLGCYLAMWVDELFEKHKIMTKFSRKHIVASTKEPLNKNLSWDNNGELKEYKDKEWKSIYEGGGGGGGSEDKSIEIEFSGVATYKFYHFKHHMFEALNLKASIVVNSSTYYFAASVVTGGPDDNTWAYYVNSNNNKIKIKVDNETSVGQSAYSGSSWTEVVGTISSVSSEGITSWFAPQGLLVYTKDANLAAGDYATAEDMLLPITKVN